MAQRERTQAGGRERSGARPAAVAAAEAGPQPLGQGELALQTSSESAECWAALHFPSLPLEALGLGPACASGRPCVVLQSEGASPRVLEANEAARRLGVLPGLGLVAALALEPALDDHLGRNQFLHEIKIFSCLSPVQPSGPGVSQCLNCNC